MTALGLRRQRPSHRVARRLAQLFSDRRSARVVGEEYLRATPGEADIDRLVELICGGEGAHRWGLETTDAATLRPWLCTKRQQDFAAGRVVVLHGWMLSVSEARLCGLIALL
jgi:hypothetical protein